VTGANQFTYKVRRTIAFGFAERNCGLTAVQNPNRREAQKEVRSI
jgi:hypothetical protein